MNRLGLTFGLVFVLVGALLAYYWRASYTEERELLRERVNAAINAVVGETFFSRLEEQAQWLTVNPPSSDTVIDLGRFSADFLARDPDLSAPEPVRSDYDLTGKARFPAPAEAPATSRSTVKVTVGRPRSASGGLRLDNIIPRITDLKPEERDSIAAAFGVSIRSFTLADTARYGTAMILNTATLGRSPTATAPRVLPPGAIPAAVAVRPLRPATVFQIHDYRAAVLRRLAPELLFGLLLLAALAFAFYSAYRSLREQRRQLTAKDALIANVAHELKTPIATVGVALEAIHQFGADASPARRREYIAIGREELGRLDRMADRAIESLRAGDLAQRLEWEPVDLAELTAEAWRGLHLRHGLPADLIELTDRTDGPVRGDRHYLFHAIHNLLDNACKYGGDPPAIGVQLFEDGDALHYVVADNGAGIAAPERRRVFEQFYRAARPGRGHAVKGHGLGLSFVDQIARAHGGAAYAAVNPPGGARVGFQIPRRGRA